jgi:hypothetical protein
MEPAGFHGGADQEEWRRRVQTAFAALVDAMAPGHGDPFPPDVPPSTQPGTWPDVPSSGVPGMTVRHQLAVVRTIATQSRANRLFPHQPHEIDAWTSRVQAAYDALDHGPALAMPESARTTPPTPVSTAKARATTGRRTSKGKGRRHTSSDGAGPRARSTAKKGKSSARKPAGKRASKTDPRANRRRRG